MYLLVPHRMLVMQNQQEELRPEPPCTFSKRKVLSKEENDEQSSQKSIAKSTGNGHGDKLVRIP